MDQNKNELAIANKYDVTTSLFGDNNRKEFTSLNPNDEADMDMLLASDSNADYKLADEVGKKITVIGVKATESEKADYNEETGEEFTRIKHTLMLFDNEGKSHVTGSNACYKSFERIIALKRALPTRDKPMTLEVIEVPAQTKGHNFIKLKFVPEVKNTPISE